MATYTVKSGDTKSKLQKQFGIALTDSQYKSSDPNKLQVGEVLNYGAPVQGPVQPFIGPIQNGKVDLSKVVENVQPYNEPTTVVSSVDRPDGTTMNRTSDGKTDVGTYRKNPDGTLTFVPQQTSGPTFQDAPVQTYENLTPEGKLENTAKTIADEIATLEEKMSKREQNRTTALDEAGVFEDMQTLNGLKDQLRTAQDRGLEIPIEGRQKLRGQQATKTEFNQLTNPALEKNVLEQLSASRATSRLTDTINTNIAIIDQTIKAETEADEFLYTQKQKRLETVQSIYGDIMTEKQKQAAADQKFQYDLLLEGVKSDNSLRSDLIKEIAKKGVTGGQLGDVMNMSIDELVKYQGNISSPTNWSTMTFEEAAMRLDPDSFKKYEAYKNFEKTATDEEKKAVEQSLALTQNAKSTITLLENMLNDTAGLKTSVGFGIGNMDFSILGGGVESAKFRANAKQLLSQATLDKLLELKAAGGTLGAISEKELEILANAATALGTITDKDGKPTGRFKFDEQDFKTALETMRTASMKTFIATSIGKEAYNRAGYINADFETIQKRYTDLIENGSKPQVDYSTQDANPSVNLETAFDTLRQEEGLRTNAYQDQTGTWTIGYGNTQINGRPVRPGDVLSKDQAESLMRKSVVENYTNFTEKIGTEMTPNQFAALTSFEYNLGSGVWNTSTGQRILQLINSGDYASAGQIMQQYNKSKNPVTGQLELNRVLAQRRAREANLLLS